MGKAIWILAAVLALTAGITDLRWRRIPNWLTYPAIPCGLLLHWLLAGWPGLKLSLAGTALGLGILFPFVLIHSLGGGDWKLVGALGAFYGPQRLMIVLILTLFINGAIALGMIVWKRRVGQTFKNLGQMTSAFARLRLPGPEMTIDNPDAIKAPFGVAAAIGVLLYSLGQPWVAF